MEKETWKRLFSTLPLRCLNQTLPTSKPKTLICLCGATAGSLFKLPHAQLPTVYPTLVQLLYKISLLCLSIDCTFSFGWTMWAPAPYRCLVWADQRALRADGFLPSVICVSARPRQGLLVNLQQWSESHTQREWWRSGLSAPQPGETG